MKFDEAALVQKLKHLAHLEDLVVLEGKAGANESVQIVDDLMSFLGGTAPSKYTNVSIKWDGCFSPETLIETDKGFKSISEIIDDYENIKVITWNHKTKKKEVSGILGVSRGPGSKKWVELILEDDSHIYCTEDHPFFSKTQQKYIEASELKIEEELFEN